MRGGIRADVLPPFEGVLLDLDGLLIDSESTYMAAWRETASRFGVSLGESFLESLRGLQASQVEAKLMEAMGSRYRREEFAPLAGEIWREVVGKRGIGRMEGADELLAWLDASGVPHALATNSTQVAAGESLAHAGLAGRFRVMVCRDEVALGKPAPDVYLEAAARLGLAPSRCLVLEDSQVGLEAASRAGTIPVLVSACPEPAGASRWAHARFASLNEVAHSLRVACL